MTAQITTLPDGTLRIVDHCLHCAAEIRWEYIVISDAGRFLQGRAPCGRVHSIPLGPNDKVRGTDGERL